MTPSGGTPAGYDDGASPVRRRSRARGSPRGGGGADRLGGTRLRRGLARAGDTEVGPAADVPGRLEDYEEAMRRDPGEAQYALRAAQIRLTARRGRRVAGGEVGGARLARRSHCCSSC